MVDIKYMYFIPHGYIKVSQIHLRRHRDFFVNYTIYEAKVCLSLNRKLICPCSTQSSEAAQVISDAIG